MAWDVPWRVSSQSGAMSCSCSSSANIASNCVASVDFDVPGKPSPPPVALDATVWRLSSADGHSKVAFEFTDPSKTIAPATTPLNAWVPDN